MKIRTVLMTAALLAATCCLPANGVYAGTQSQIKTVALESGAERDGTFVSADETFTDADQNTRELHMTGLKDANKEKMIECLEKNYSDADGAVPLEVIDEAFCDAEKWDNSDDGKGYDSGHCWLASISNSLWLSGWTKYFDSSAQTFTSEDELFWLCNDSFYDSGGEFSSGVDWFFMGEYYKPNAKTSADLRKLSPEHGFRKDLVSTLMQTHYDMKEDASYIQNLLKIGKGESVFGGSLGGLSDGAFSDSTHAVTIAGVITDPDAASLEDRYKAIIIIDSDNHASPDQTERAAVEAAAEEEQTALKQNYKAARPNSYTIYPLKYYEDRNGVAGWLLEGYSNPDAEEEDATIGTGLIYINELPLPSEERIREITETDGTMDHMSDPDLTLDTMFMTEDEDGFTNPYSYAAQEAAETEFPCGDAIRLNYFVSNRGPYDLTDIREYSEGKELRLTWKVTRDDDGSTVAEGSHICELPVTGGLTGGSEDADLVTVNEEDGEIASWETGSYTLTAELNADKAVTESYYLNNLPKEIRFSVIPNKEMAQQAVEDAEKAVGSAKAALDAFDPDDYATEAEAQAALAEAKQAVIDAQDALIEAQFVLSKAEKRELEKRVAELEEQVEDLEDQLFDASYIDISNYAVTLAKTSYEYTGKAIEPAVKVSGLTEEDDYYVDYENNIRIGTATITITGTGMYTGTIEKTFRITKIKSPLKVKARKPVKLKAATLRRKSVGIRRARMIKVSGAKGGAVYRLMSVNRYQDHFKINSKTGRLTVKKGLKKGTYKVKVKVKASGNSRYASASGTVTLTVKVS